MGDWGGLILMRNGAIPGIGVDAILLRAGFLAKTQSRKVWLARVGLPANHANIAHPPSDKAITPSSLHNYVARLSTFNFLATNPGRPRKTRITRKLCSVGIRQHPDTSVVDFAKNPCRQGSRTSRISPITPRRPGTFSKVHHTHAA